MEATIVLFTFVLLFTTGGARDMGEFVGCEVICTIGTETLI